TKRRLPWIMARGDVERYEGRTPLPIDDGRRIERKGGLPTCPAATTTPLRAKPGRNVTQMHYARAGIVTPEMEYIAVRENQKREELVERYASRSRGGRSFGARLALVDAGFVRQELAAGRARPPSP